MNLAKRLVSILISLIVVFSMPSGFPVKAGEDKVKDAALNNTDFQASVILPEKFDLSPALASLRGKESLSPNFPKNLPVVLPKANTFSPLQHEFQQENLQPDTLLNGEMPEPLISFDGVSNLFGGWPPDTQGDIGPSHYVQWINLHLAIWQIDKAGMTAELVVGPLPGNTIFQGFGGACEMTNDGDPITLYDAQADRWFMSQFALPNFPNGPFVQCLAVSQSSDPTGAWYRYAYPMPVDKMNDYPKFGVWPDAYYMTVNMFNAGSLSYGGVGAAAFEREAMLQGEAAALVFFDLYDVNSLYGGMLPADVDGLIDPFPGSPGIFVEWDDASWIGPQDALSLWEFHVDWSQPENSTFGLSGAPNLIIPTANVDPNLCYYQRECIPQPGTSRRVDAISDRLMYRLQYRNFGGYETLVANHTVDVNGSDWAGIHWFELRRTTGDWAMHQEGVHAPDSQHRWMGSAALDHMGNLALGYSASSNSLYPSVRYAGRLVSDPAGTLPLAEQSLVAGGGSQTGSSRWGDYSMLGVDPVEDCTFWYTQEYVASTGSNSWKTRIGAFRFPDCAIGTQGVINGNVSANASGLGIQKAMVQAFSGATMVGSTLTNQDGYYALNLEEGIYEIKASAYGYMPVSATDIQISTANVTTQDFSLSLAPMHTVSGYVKDEQTGWPLYASIKVSGLTLPTIWSDPITGFYQLDLPQGGVYSFQVDAWVDGYLSALIEAGPFDDDLTQDLLLQIDPGLCAAPGYQLEEIPGSGAECQAQVGGFVAGFVFDENTGLGIEQAVVSDMLGNSAQSGATPGDSGAQDGYYVLFSDPGVQTITAEKAGGYQSQNAAVTVLRDELHRQDFNLPAGLLAIEPISIELSLSWGMTQTIPLTLTNLGGVDLNFSLVELEQEELAPGYQQTPDFVVKPFKQGAATGSGLGIPTQPTAALLDGGEILTSWAPAGSQNFWGLAYAAHSDQLWLSSPASTWGGDDHLYDYDRSGVPGLHAYLHPMPHTYGTAGMTYNWNTGMLWMMNINQGVANCIYEIDLGTGYTGRSICPGGGSGFSASQRGLAYDPASDTWFAGGWNDLMIYRFNRKGEILEAVYTGLAVSGLAYNPDTHHLFAMVSADPTNVYVLDAGNHFAVTGMFPLQAGFPAYAGAGLELDCDGNLWGMDLVNRRVTQFTSGETTNVCDRDVNWLIGEPQNGVLPAFDQQVISLTLDARQSVIDQIGEYFSRIKFVHDTPYLAPDLPVQLTVIPAVYGVQLSADQAGEDIPGQVFAYTLNLTNTSLGLTDHFSIDIAGQDWLTQVETTVIGPLNSGETVQVVVNVHIPELATPAGNDLATITATSWGDAAKTDVVLLTTTTLMPEADVEVIKTANSALALPGEVLSYTIQVSNHGPTKAAQVTLVDVLPRNMSYHSDDADCALSDYVLVCDLGMLAVDENRNIHVWAVPTRGGIFVNQAVAILDADPDDSNNWTYAAIQIFWRLLFPTLFLQP